MHAYMYSHEILHAGLHAYADIHTHVWVGGFVSVGQHCGCVDIVHLMSTITKKKK